MQPPQPPVSSRFIGYKPRDLNPARKQAINSLLLKEVVYWARFEGAQIRIDGQTVYRGAEFATDTNGADSSLAEIWRAWGESFLERLNVLLTQARDISIFAYRGDRWAFTKSLPVL